MIFNAPGCSRPSETDFREACTKNGAIVEKGLSPKITAKCPGELLSRELEHISGPGPFRFCSRRVAGPVNVSFQKVVTLREILKVCQTFMSLRKLP